jgi:type IV pilus assembly protein PilN
MRISLNLATRPFADVGPAIKRLRIAMGVLALVAIGLVLGLRAFDQKAEIARARDHSLDGQIAHIAQERQGYQNLMSEPANVQLLQQAGALNKLFDEKAFSWTLAMEDLETVLPSGVQVTTIEPVRAKDGHITLHLRVIGPRDRAVDLVRNLEHSKRFLLPRIVGENAEATAGAGERLEPVSESNRVNFDLLAEYNPALPGEHRTAKKRAGENAEATAGAGERLEPVSESNRVNFDLLAEYNPALPGEHRTAKKRAGENKSSDDADLPVSPVPVGPPATIRPRAGHGFGPAQGPGRPPYTGSPQTTIPNRNPALLPNPPSGGPQ